jgi:DNA-directed RNA polymerase subunit RPC12/RpoP
LKLWIRRKRGNRKIECSVCGRKFRDIYDTSEQDLPRSALTATVMVEVHRVNCPECGVKREKAPLLPSKAPFSQRFEEAPCVFAMPLTVPPPKRLLYTTDVYNLYTTDVCGLRHLTERKNRW